MLNLVLRVWLPLVKKQPSKVVFLLCCKGGGGLILLRHARNCKQTRSRSPPPTTLLMWRHSFADAKRRGFLVKFECNEFTFSRCGSRRLNFTNLSNRSRGEVFLRLDAADLKFCDGSYLVGSDRAKFKSNKV